MPMELIAIKTRKIVAGDDVSAILSDQRLEIRDQDILVISSKAIATAEGRIIDLSKLTVSAEAKEYAEKSGLSEELCQAVLEETAERKGKVVGNCPGALLTELRPWQHDTHSILLPNDILVISSKAVATAEGRIIDLSKSTVSAEAKKYAAAA